MTQIHFTKMQGLGNDFMVVNGVNQSFHPTSEIIRQLAHRHTGIGFDQLLIVESVSEPASESAVELGADFFYRIFNADGTEVAQCGNGARCVARFIHEQGLSHHDHLKVATKAGILELYLKPEEQVSVNMGVPKHAPVEIPFIVDERALIYTFETPLGVVPISTVSLGNPHCVIEVPDINTAPVQELGAYIATHSRFPEGVNVGFMQIENARHIRLRVYERGVGETLGCGSGACAAVIVGRQLGKLDEQVEVSLPGGKLSLSWADEGSPVWMAGVAVTVFEGSIQL
jgi:diaminopimelate epimerase